MEELQVEWLILADKAELVNGKLYMMGGGWDHLNVSELPKRKSFSIAVAIEVPWTRTNEKHKMEIEITDEDHKESLAKIDAQFQVGRPPLMPSGSSQRVKMAFTVESFEFKQPGLYVIQSSVNGTPDRSIAFSVNPSPQLQAKIDAQAS